MRILITGITGFVGGHLTELLLREGNPTLIGYGRGSHWPAELSGLASQTILVEGELRDQAQLTAVLKRHRPESVYHLAGYANPGKSREEPEICRESNVEGTRSLCQAIVDSGITPPRVLLASTGQVYGPLEQQPGLVDEHAPLRPDTPYAQSKLEAENLSQSFPGIPMLRVRMFNQIGPRQLGGYFTSDVASDLVKLERGQISSLKDRHFFAYRDFTDVRDMVRALQIIMNRGQPGEVYNACSGTVRSLYDVFTGMLKQLHIPYPVPAPPANYGQPSHATSSDRLKSLGWQPTIPLDQTLADILNFWRARTRGNTP